ncbi:hypothetical protein [Streptomyces sp. NPDC002994]|uniref:hypothetical protein n=1 Tax=Streptomyces sp. NPDC002994 TaxID=3154441 RepID=UPI0033B7D817
MRTGARGRLSARVVGSALEQLAAEGLVTLRDGYPLYSVVTMALTERAYRLMRTVIHRSCERFMTRDEIARTFEIGTKEAAAGVGRLVTEGLLTGPRGQYVNEFSPEQQRRRVRQGSALACRSAGTSGQVRLLGGVGCGCMDGLRHAGWAGR